MSENTIASIMPADKNVEQSQAALIAKNATMENSDKVVANSDQIKVEKANNEQPKVEGISKNPFRDVELKFVRDDNSNQMTVYVVDRTTKSVLRSIPPEDIGKLNVGDLLEITA
jgi:uncharacterized FlaG/YvyC family protein